jgi:elongation factor Ts
MAVSMEKIKEPRELIGAGVLECKNTLEQTDGDLEKAAEILREKGLAAAAKKAEREANEGRVEVYIHPGNKLVAVVDVRCETDFVARTPEFVNLSHDLAMQVAATNPRYISRGDVPENVISEQREAFMAEVGDGKPDHIIERIMEGKFAKFYQEQCLLDQAFIKDETKTVQQLLTETIARLGENMVIQDFGRFSIDR